MTDNNVLGPTGRDTTEWNSAWEIVRRLAAARRDALEAMKETQASARAIGRTSDPALGYSLSEHATGYTAASDSGQYARAIAEIEQASAAL